MAGEWKETKLGEILTFANGKASPERAEGFAFPVYGSNGIIGFANETNSEPNSIIIGRVGSYCGSLYFSREACWVTDNAIRAVAINNNSPHFSFYLLSTLQLNRWRGGSGQPLLNQSTLSIIPVQIPPPEEQRAIACILGALDDKIELNRRMNETLEQIAQAIFKKWFIEPTKKGKLPEGWKVSKLGDIADVNWGDTNVTKKSYVDYGFLAFSAKGPDGFLPYYDYNRVGVVVSAIGANSGYTWLARGKWSCIKNTIRFWAIAPDISTEYLYFITHGNHIWPIRGSAQPFISQTDARNLPILHPADALAKQFGEIVAPMFEKMYFNDQQSRTLAALRDTLLPKLISGELRVPDSEKICARGASALGGMERCL